MRRLLGWAERDDRVDLVFHEGITRIARVLNRAMSAKRNRYDIKTTYRHGSRSDLYAGALQYVRECAMTSRSSFVCVIARSIACAIVAALVVVPTITRSRQHIRLRPSTRLSIRLNWQSDTPPQRTIVPPDDASARVVATVTPVQPPQDARFSPHVRVGEEPTVQSPFENVLDLFRRPPPRRI